MVWQRRTCFACGRGVVLGWGVLDRLKFLATLPRKRVAAGALIRDEQGRICIVEPTYKPQWQFPGGTVEANESPATGCRREVLEELGLEVQIGRLLGIGWVLEDKDPDGALIMVYDGGVLTPDRIAAIVLPSDELSAYRFVPSAEVGRWVSQLNARRAVAALRALEHGDLAEFDRGDDDPSTRLGVADGSS